MAICLLRVLLHTICKTHKIKCNKHVSYIKINQTKKSQGISKERNKRNVPEYYSNCQVHDLFMTTNFVLCTLPKSKSKINGRICVRTQNVNKNKY